MEKYLPSYRYFQFPESSCMMEIFGPDKFIRHLEEGHCYRARDYTQVKMKDLTRLVEDNLPCEGRRWGH